MPLPDPHTTDWPAAQRDLRDLDRRLTLLEQLVRDLIQRVTDLENP